MQLLMIDEEGTLAQGFIGQNRCNQYEKELERGSIYTLTNFYASNSKVMSNVADQKLVICISHASALSKVEENIEEILTERFRIHSFSEFEANCDLRGDLHASPSASGLCTKDNSTSRRVMVHLQLKEVFLDEEVDPTKEYLTWLTRNPSATSLVNPVEVVKAETLTISEIAAFIKSQPAKIAYFDCIATIDDVKLGTEWYYIACMDCQTKLNCGPTTMMCPKCSNENATAVADYRVEISVYDNEEQCIFVILGDAGKELTGRKATELIDTYVEENGGDETELEVPLPQCLIDTIGQTKKFRIKVAPYNFTSTRLSFTATRIVSSAVLPPKNPPLTTPPIPLSKTQNSRAATEVQISDVAGSIGGGPFYANNDPTTGTEDQKKPKRIKRSG
ncbi:hypothetical protein Bca52824_026327 [Brassica carinata]|uniref:Replication factor A C-terminal domain-containing protein n=1 Tax=Brassica carinata TaxID=52824 RepID=A0A8X7SKZ7_BRACI|nr:hypothetical protein Bca52824_026327 [Brassica carinata]